MNRRDEEATVPVPIDAWRRLQQFARPSLRQLVLAPQPSFEIPAPVRGGLRRRAATVLD
jgi:hypothetical protein